MFRFVRNNPLFTAVSSVALSSGLRFSTSSVKTTGSSNANANATSSSQEDPLKPSRNRLLEPVDPKVITYPISDESATQTPYEIGKEDEYRYNILPPIAKQRATYTYLPWDTIVDYYAYLRDRKSEETLSYLRAENAYTEHKMKHTAKIQDTLYGEMLTRIVEDDSSVPAKNGPYVYYSRTEAGKPYKIYCRRKAGSNSSSDSDSEEILLNVNELAEGKDFMSIGSYEVTPDHKILAYSTDEKGDEYFTLRFKDLETGELLPDCIERIADDVAFCNDNETLYYIKYDQSWRPYQLWRHKLGEDVANDTLVCEEDDNKYRLSIYRTLSDEYMILHIGSALTDEVWVQNANDPLGNNGMFQCIAEREQGIEYSVEHHRNPATNTNEFLVLMNNENAINFELFSAAIETNNSSDDSVAQIQSKPQWKRIIAHDADVTLQSVSCFQDFVVIQQRHNGLAEFRIRYQNASTVEGEHVIALPESSYTIWESTNLEYDTDQFRFMYTSLVTPSTTYDYQLGARVLETRKVQNTNEYAKENYQSFRVYASAIDGTKIPISCIARADFDVAQNASPNPFYLVGYGSYGYPYDVYFSSNRLSLVDRGVIIGYAHVRGGGEFGRKWKLDGKLRKKMNTFQDFFACAEHISSAEVALTNSSLLVAEGRSAGGILMGAAINMRPDLFKAIVADVPFVDVINTVLDEEIPLTSNEWEEWGDPRTMEDYFYIKSYSPYDNITGQQVPNLLIEAGLNDNRVQYWEPAKFVAKLREYQRRYQHLYPDENKANDIMLKTEMSSGHSGASGRYGKIKQIAFEYAFILDQLNATDVVNELVTIDHAKVDKSKKVLEAANNSSKED